MKLRVEFFYDDESKNWGFSVPALNIVGGEETREKAEKMALEAIDFALEGVPQDFDNDVDEVAYFDVQVTRAKVEAPAR
ncbi:MAG TPA: hypothetical protein VK457_12255 [Chloroflexota bacterium]|nr:hypothetical protein [Chloroflexota bacterium]